MNILIIKSGKIEGKDREQIIMADFVFQWNDDYTLLKVLKDRFQTYEKGSFIKKEQIMNSIDNDRIQELRYKETEEILSSLGIRLLDSVTQNL